MMYLAYDYFPLNPPLRIRFAPKSARTPPRPRTRPGNSAPKFAVFVQTWYQRQYICIFGEPKFSFSSIVRSTSTVHITAMLFETYLNLIGLSFRGSVPSRYHFIMRQNKRTDLLNLGGQTEKRTASFWCQRKPMSLRGDRRKQLLQTAGDS